MTTRCLAALLLLLHMAGANAQDHHHHDETAACAEPTLACASTATPFFAPDGVLWLTWAAANQILVAHSADRGAHFSAPVTITLQPEHLDGGGDARPQVVVDAKGNVTVAYAVFLDQHYNGQVRVSRSTDSGAHFSAPAPITGDSPSQRFQTMALDASGRIFAAWLDKRNVASARARGEKYGGAALAFAWSDNGSFPAARIAVDNTCECCRIGLGWAAPGRPVVVFRDIFEDKYRDHALILFSDEHTPGPVHRVSEDHWAIDACPHHGPALAVSPAGTIHTAWYTGGGPAKGLFYARTTDGGMSFSKPMRLGDDARQNGRATLLAPGRETYLAWKSFDGERSDISLIVSHDDGATWTAPRIIASTTDKSDHPLLISDGTTVFLSWLTQQEGYRLIPLENGS